MAGAASKTQLAWLALAVAALASIAYIVWGEPKVPPPIREASSATASRVSGPPTPRIADSSPTPPASGAVPVEAGACGVGAELLEETHGEGTRASGCARKVDGFVVREGMWTLVDTEGRTMSGEYAANKREGKWTAWYPSRVVFQRVDFVHDKKEGWWIQWAEDGHKVFEKPYKDDRLDGTATEYGPDGGVERTTWKDGQRVD